MKSQDSLLLLFYVGALLRHPKARALPFAGRPPEVAREGPAPVYPDAITLPESDYSLAQVGSVLHISKAELHRSHNRLQDAALLKLVDKRPPATGQWINFPNAKEWILYGIRYAHPARREGFGIGLPTGFNCPLLKDLPLLPPEPANVLAGPSSPAAEEREGVIINPLDKRIARGLELSPELYLLLALVDAIRIGGPRELRYAREALERKLMNGASIQERAYRDYQKY